MKKYFLLAVIFSIHFHFSFSQRISDFSPKQIIGGIGATLTLSGSGFGNSQGFSYVSYCKENNTYSDASDGKSIKYLSWNDREIKIEMPAAFSNKINIIINANVYTSVDTLHVSANVGYRQLNPLTYDYLTDNNGSGGITWYIHPIYWQNQEIKQAIFDVIREFRCKTGVNYSLAELKKWIPLSTQYGIHVIAPDSNLNVVGFNDKLWSSCILGSETLYYNKTQLIRINSKEKWYYGTGKAPGGTSKFRYVLFHEMGHSLGLGHVNEIGQSMFPSVTLLPSNNWSQRDTITTAEKIAISQYIKSCQNFTFRGCGVTPMRKISNCNDIEYSVSSNANFTDNKDSYIIYPNPCYTNEIFIHPTNSNITSPTKVNIINNFGQIVKSTTINNSEPLILPNNLSSGIYIINIYKSDKQYNYLLNVFSI